MKKPSIGDIFGIPLKDERIVVAQILDYMMPNVVSCAIYDHIITKREEYQDADNAHNIIATLSVDRHGFMKNGTWRVLSNQAVTLPRNLWPNEEFRDQGWVGAETYSHLLVEAFINAYYGLAPWNIMDPEGFDDMLITPDRKPPKDRLIWK